MENNTKKLEKNLIEMTKLKEERDRVLLNLEIFIVLLVTVVFLICVFITSFINTREWIKILIIIGGLIPFIIGVLYALKIEQIAGYYECHKCHYKFVPTYKSVFWAMHIGRTRYMKCPSCKKRSWNRKVLSKDSNND